MPGDKSIAHRAVLMAALAKGTSLICGVPDGDDVARSAQAVQMLGAEVSPLSGGVQVHGGRDRLFEPCDVLDMGNSGTGMRLLAGIAAALPWLSVLSGDRSLRSRPMARVVEPLREMGAHIDGRRNGDNAPLVVRGGNLKGIYYRPAQASAQVKSAVLLAGLSAQGDTTVEEKVPTRAHTEELLERFGAKVRVEPELSSMHLGGRRVTVSPSELHPVELTVPGDPSQAAYWVVAGCLIPHSEVTVKGVYSGPCRNGFLDVLERMGADLKVRSDQSGTLDITSRFGPITGTTVYEQEVPALIDEVPVLAVAAAMAHGDTSFHGLGELRVKESDRLNTIAELISSLGGRAEVVGDDLVVSGSAGEPLTGGPVDSHGDHRIAMAAAVGGLAATGKTVIRSWESVDTSYPSFAQDMSRLLQ